MPDELPQQDQAADQNPAGGQSNVNRGATNNIATGVGSSLPPTNSSPADQFRNGQADTPPSGSIETGSSGGVGIVDAVGTKGSSTRGEAASDETEGGTADALGTGFEPSDVAQRDAAGDDKGEV